MGDFPVTAALAALRCDLRGTGTSLNGRALSILKGRKGAAAVRTAAGINYISSRAAWLAVGILATAVGCIRRAFVIAWSARLNLARTWAIL